jgi:hypothetical protein
MLMKPIIVLNLATVGQGGHKADAAFSIVGMGGENQWKQKANKKSFLCSFAFYVEG